jgi:hypothetical protein
MALSAGLHTKKAGLRSKKGEKISLFTRIVSCLIFKKMEQNRFFISR